MAREELVGMMFTTPKELRHLAEEHYGELFVPTEVVAEGGRYGLFALTVGGGRIIVRAERTGPRAPYEIIRIEVEEGGRRIA
jgi:hypothetical protein